MSRRTTLPARGAIGRLALAAFALCLIGAAPAAASRGERTAYKPSAKTIARAAAATKAPAPLPSHKLGSRTLRMKMRGTDVRALQYFLGNLQLSSSAVDGVYGKQTRRSVVAFERSRKMKVDGRVQRKEGRRIKVAAKRKLASGSFVFPVAGPHTFGGAGSRFGAPRSGHIHQGQDVAAPCGTPLLAAQGGTVRVNKYQAGGAGNYIVIRGAVNGEDYMYAHLIAPATPPVGSIVPVGSQIGLVGSTGDSSGCHLHFEMWAVPGWYLGGQPYDPLPSLTAWDAYS